MSPPTIKNLLRELFEASDRHDADHVDRILDAFPRAHPELAKTTIELFIERIKHHYETKVQSGFELDKRMQEILDMIGIDPETDDEVRSLRSFVGADKNERRKRGISPLMLMAVDRDAAIIAKLLLRLDLPVQQTFCEYLRSRDLALVAACALTLYHFESLPLIVVMSIAGSAASYIFDPMK
jgi:hypothetical protein